MADTNNTSTLDNVNGNVKVAVNSIQRTLFVERLHVDITSKKDRILPYDYDNLYPNKIKSIAQRSGTTMSAIGTYSSFMTGVGFMGMETIVNRKGQTFEDILTFISEQKAMFKGYVLHFNFNLLGQIVEINPVNFEFVRWNKDLNGFIVNPDWKRRYLRMSEEIEYNMFNPSKVEEQINAVGIDKYKGQLLYCIPNLADYYTTCTFDSVLDDAQFEAEAKLYSLSSIQNDYSLSGLISYPKSITDDDEIEEIKNDIKNDSGSSNAGGIRVIGALPKDGLNNWKWFTPMSRNNVDGLHKNQKEDAINNIYALFRQPPILNGVTSQGMFNESSFADAFHYYNTATQTERNELSKELNKIIAQSIWSNLGEIEIQAKKFDTREITQANEQQLQAQASEVNDTLTNLSGRQMQGLQRVISKFGKGDFTKEQAATLLKNGYGFSDEQIEVWLINNEEA